MSEAEDRAGQSTMLKWILGLVATGLGSIAVWIGSQMKSQTDFTQKLVERADEHRAEQFKADIEQAKALHLLSTNVAASTEVMKGVQKQGEETVKYLKSIDTVQKRFPAVREDP
jgi:hypothetical protein